jgi:hypothetical protein
LELHPSQGIEAISEGQSLTRIKDHRPHDLQFLGLAPKSPAIIHYLHREPLRNVLHETGSNDRDFAAHSYRDKIALPLRDNKTSGSQAGIGH